MNSDNMNTPTVINPSLMNGNNNVSTSNTAADKKANNATNNNKNSKITLDKNGKPKRKKASRGKYSIAL